MASYFTSKFRRALQLYQCAGCRGSIRKGEEYLYHQHGEGRHPVCLPCSLTLDEHGAPVYFCRAVVARLTRTCATRPPMQHEGT